MEASAQILRGVYPERSRRAQNDSGGCLGVGLTVATSARWVKVEFRWWVYPRCLPLASWVTMCAPPHCYVPLPASRFARDIVTTPRCRGRFETCPYSTIGSRAGLTARWEVYPDGGGGPGSRRGRCRSRPEDAVTDSRRGPRGLRRRRRTHGSAGRRCWTRPRAGP